MERRYGREVKRYQAQITKKPKKTPLEKIIIRQSGVCAFLIAIGIIVPYADAGSARYVKEVLYKSSTLNDWKDTFYPAFETAKKGAVKTVLFINDSAKSVEEKFGINTKTDNAPVKAKAKKKEKTENKEIEVNQANEPKEVVFKVPTEGEITSVFGSRIHPMSGDTKPHTGIDIAAPAGQTVISAAEGMVTKTGYDDANGHYIVVKHTEELTTVYAHLSKVCVSENEAVDDNTKIGEVGSSGISTGPHLHFEIKLNQESVNPENYITLTHRDGE